MRVIGPQNFDGLVPTAAIADNAVTLAKMAGGTDGNLIGIDANGDPAYIATGSDGHVLTSGGANVASAMEALSASGFTQGTEQATTSGTAITFGSIPTGTMMIIINFKGVSLGAGDFQCTLGDAGGLETSGYVSIGMTLLGSADPIVGSSTAAFDFDIGAGGCVANGQMILTLENASAFTWCASYNISESGSQTAIGNGQKSLSAELTQVSVSGGTFDAGAMNIMYL
jgi:hypothetical protein